MNPFEAFVRDEPMWSLCALILVLMAVHGAIVATVETITGRSRPERE